MRVEAEGEKQEVDAFLAAIEEQMLGLVRHVEHVADERTRQFSGFTVR